MSGYVYPEVLGYEDYTKNKNISPLLQERLETNPNKYYNNKKQSKSWEEEYGPKGKYIPTLLDESFLRRLKTYTKDRFDELANLPDTPENYQAQNKAVADTIRTGNAIDKIKDIKNKYFFSKRRSKRRSKKRINKKSRAPKKSMRRKSRTSKRT